MCISQKDNIKIRLLIDDQQVEQVSQFKYLGSWISDDGYATEDIRARIPVGITHYAIPHFTHSRGDVVGISPRFLASEN